MGNVGRNDPCPCGSGKKYKKCCGQKSSMQRRQFSSLGSGEVKSSMSKITGMVSQTLKSIQPDTADKFNDLIKEQTDKLAAKMSADPAKTKEEAGKEIVDEIIEEEAAKEEAEKDS